MAAMMLVSLYTSRIILDALGEIDMGIYNAVGGIVMMFSFLSGTMSTACQRFFAVKIGEEKYDELKNIFSMSVIVFTAIALIIVILCETIGLWFLLEKANTADRSNAAHWVFQLSIISFIFSIFRTPYQGIVIIKEKMKIFAYISIAEVLGNLAIAIIISHSTTDRLILYAGLILAINIIVSLFYVGYCRHSYNECHFNYWWDKKTFWEIFGFAGWNMIGSLSGICKSQGLNMLLNVFFGPAVNAARAMTYKVYSTIQQFADNFFTAVKPQLLKSYSNGNIGEMHKLIFQSSKFSYYLLFIVSLPILLETQPILDVWLKNVPEYTTLFTRLVIVNALIEVLANPLAVSMQAYGNIRNYHLICGGFTLTILPVSFLFLKLHFPPETVFYVSIIICSLAIGIRAIFVRHAIGLSMTDYLVKTILPIIMITALSVPLPLIFELKYAITGFTKFMLVCGSSIIISSVAILFVGMTKTERKHLFEFLSNIIKRKDEMA